MHKTRTTTAMTAAAALSLTLAIGACSSGATLTEAETAACTAISQLDEGDSDTTWNSAFDGLVDAKNSDLADLYATYELTPLTSPQAALPYRDMAIRICSDGGWAAPETSQGD